MEAAAPAMEAAAAALAIKVSLAEDGSLVYTGDKMEITLQDAVAAKLDFSGMDTDGEDFIPHLSFCVAKHLMQNGGTFHGAEFPHLPELQPDHPLQHPNPGVQQRLRSRLVVINELRFFFAKYSAQSLRVRLGSLRYNRYIDRHPPTFMTHKYTGTLEEPCVIMLGLRMRMLEGRQRANPYLNITIAISRHPVLNCAQQ